MAKTNNRFKKGSGVFTCLICKRATRDTGKDNTEMGYCAECYEVAGIENLLQDERFETPAEAEELENKIKELNAQIVAKGGKL